MIFRDRIDAGRRLAERLRSSPRENGIVLALPRGGVVVGYEVARALDLPLDVILAQKIGAPFQPEYAIGVVAENGFVSVNRREIQSGTVSNEYMQETIARLRREIARRQHLFRQGGGRPDLASRTVIVVDDGVATGFTLLGAVAAIKDERPGRIIVGLPVAPAAVVGQLHALVDEVLVLETPEPFDGVGRWYADFDPVPDEDVVTLLDRARAAQPTSGVPGSSTGPHSDAHSEPMEHHQRAEYVERAESRQESAFLTADTDRH